MVGIALRDQVRDHVLAGGLAAGADRWADIAQIEGQQPCAGFDLVDGGLQRAFVAVGEKAVHPARHRARIALRKADDFSRDRDCKFKAQGVQIGAALGAELRDQAFGQCDRQLAVAGVDHFGRKEPGCRRALPVVGLAFLIEDRHDAGGAEPHHVFGAEAGLAGRVAAQQLASDGEAANFHRAVSTAVQSGAAVKFARHGGGLAVVGKRGSRHGHAIAPRWRIGGC